MGKMEHITLLGDAWSHWKVFGTEDQAYHTKDNNRQKWENYLQPSC